MRKSIVFIMALTMLTFVASAQALVEYTANFDAGQEGWFGDGENWSATDGQDGGGYYFGMRTNYAPYLVPPETSILWGNVVSNFENEIMTFSYYLKDISDSMATPPQMYVFVDSDGGGWDMFWANTPVGEGMLEEWNGIPKEWTKYAFSIDPTAAEAPEGWTMTKNSPSSPESTWAESWQQIAYWNFWSGYGTAGVDNSVGIDTVLVTNDPAAIILPPVDIPGDANSDGIVDANDASSLASNWLQSGKVWADGDFNEDGIVNDLDATILASNWQTTAAGSAVPEPGTIGLLLAALASLLVVRSKRC